jgi:hypothetical protein
VEREAATGLGLNTAAAIAATAERDERMRRAPLAAEEVAAVLRTSSLTAEQERYITVRWGCELARAELNERRSRHKFYAARTVAVIGAVILPALIGLQLDGTAAEAVRWTAFAVSLVVAIATALEQLFRNGQRWRLYRGKRDELRAIGWRWTTRIGSTDQAGRRRAPSFDRFARDVEEIIDRYDDRYLEEVLLPTRGDGNDTTDDREDDAAPESIKDREVAR